MRKVKLFIPAILVFGLSAISSFALASPEEGRYVLAMPGSAIGGYSRQDMNAKAPAVVLDTLLGIVWRCQNIKDEKPLWIRADLAKIGDKELSGKRYAIQIPDYPNSGSKIPAIVLDKEEGKVWICANIADESSAWVQKDLAQDMTVDGYKYR